MYEEKSETLLEYTYSIPNSNEQIKIKSSGWYFGNESSIIYQDREYSKNKRGLNFLVIDLNDFSILDTAYCDISRDDFILIDSDYLSVFKK